MMNKLIRTTVSLTGTFFFFGRIPGPGGTYGSLIMMSGAWLIFSHVTSAILCNAVIALIALLAFMLSVFVGRHAAAVFGRPDPNCVIIDEIAGAGIALLAFPFKDTFRLPGCISAFILFRIFDIWKPYGIRYLEGVKSGYGIVMDDAVAGIYTLIIIQISGILLNFL